MIEIIKNFFMNNYFSFSPRMRNYQYPEDTCQQIWLNIARDFNKSFEKIREEYEKRN